MPQTGWSVRSGRNALAEINGAWFIQLHIAVHSVTNLLKQATNNPPSIATPPFIFNEIHCIWTAPAKCWIYCRNWDTHGKIMWSCRLSLVPNCGLLLSQGHQIRAPALSCATRLKIRFKPVIKQIHDSIPIGQRSRDLEHSRVRVSGGLPDSRFTAGRQVNDECTDTAGSV